ncbi:MAG: integral rane sensor signal transduction histidine kinase [Chlorobi bacterium]|nr:integral rane sensor signal transduction histidine kinase [Chlorobiota bacterium]
MFTITTRIVLAYTLVFGIMLTGFAFVIYRSTEQAAIEKIDARLESHADKISTEIEEEMGDGEFPAVQDIHALTTNGLHDVRLQVMDTTGQTLLSDSLLPILPAGVIRAASSRRISVADIRIGGREYRARTSPVDVENNHGLIMRIAAPLDEVREDSDRLKLIFLILIPLSLLVGAIAALIITRAGFRPISAMVSSANRITAANLDQRLAVPGTRDEIRHLAETLNAMIERIGVAFQQQRQFIADASHEIRTPLTIIKTELEFGERSDEIGEVKESIGIALGEVDRMTSLTQSLLLLVRLDSPHHPLNTGIVRLDEIVMRSVNRMQGLAQSREITLAPHIAEAIEAEGDEEKLERALINLIDNAIKYSDRGGIVSIALERLDAIARVTVRDNGPGISAASLPYIFERFHRADESRARGEGHGLGLAIVRRVVELHGGSVRAESIENAGASFIIDLPLR